MFSHREDDCKDMHKFRIDPEAIDAWQRLAHIHSAGLDTSPEICLAITQFQHPGYFVESRFVPPLRGLHIIRILER